MMNWGAADVYWRFRLIEDRNCYRVDKVQFRFPRSKKVRIRRKWARQAKNFKFNMTPLAYQVGDYIVAHPTIVRQIMIQMKQTATTATT